MMERERDLVRRDEAVRTERERDLDRDRRELDLELRRRRCETPERCDSSDELSGSLGSLPPGAMWRARLRRTSLRQGVD